MSGSARVLAEQRDRTGVVVRDLEPRQVGQVDSGTDPADERPGGFELGGHRIRDRGASIVTSRTRRAQPRRHVQTGAAGGGRHITTHMDEVSGRTADDEQPGRTRRPDPSRSPTRTPTLAWGREAEPIHTTATRSGDDNLLIDINSGDDVAC